MLDDPAVDEPRHRFVASLENEPAHPLPEKRLGLAHRCLEEPLPLLEEAARQAEIGRVAIVDELRQAPPLGVSAPRPAAAIDDLPGADASAEPVDGLLVGGGECDRALRERDAVTV